MGPSFSRKYNTLLVDATAIYLPIVKRAVVDYALGADWTPAAGDVKISIDGGAAANVTNLPTAVTMGNTAMWKFILTAAELTGKQMLVTIADASTKVVEDQMFSVETYGHASAMYAADLSAANLPANVVQVAGTAQTAGDIAALLATISGYIDTEIANIQSRLPTALTADGNIKADVLRVGGTLQTAGDIFALASSIAGYIDTEMAAVKAKTDALTFTGGNVDVNLKAVDASTVAVAAFLRAILGTAIGTVGSGSATTSVVTSSLTPAASVADQFKGRILTFAQDTSTAALRGQSTDITASTSGGVLTVTALTTAPSSGDTFSIT